MRTWLVAAALAVPASLGATGCAGAPPQITSLTPANGSRGVGGDEPIRVVFDHAVEHASVAARFRIDPQLEGCDARAAFSAGPSAPCHVTWTADSASFTFLHPGALFVPDVKYHMHLDPGVTDTAGVANNLDHSWELTAGSAPVPRVVSPADGSTGVPVDSPMSVVFSSAMAVAPTESAIELSPPVPGTRVVVNSLDHSRFVLLPGRLLTPGRRYTLSIGTAATDEHRQHLALPVQSVFTADGLGGGGHALVLARGSGEPPSALVLTRAGPEQAGEPTPAVTLLAAPRCLTAGCPPLGGPAVAFLEAALSPTGRQVAVVEHDVLGAAPDRLVLVDLPSLATTVVAGGAAHPSWSVDGSLLAFGAGGAVELYRPATRTRVELPAGAPLDAPPVWSDDGSVLALPVRRPGSAPTVELADPQLLARYPVPGLGPGATSPALSPSGDRLAVRVDPPAGAAATGGAGTWIVSLLDRSAPQLLSPTLTPVGWADAGTLLGVDRAPGGSGLVRVAVAGGDVAALSSGPRDSDLSTVVADPRDRRLGYLLPDADGTVQAWAMNDDGSNPIQLTSMSPADGLSAIAVSLGG